ncbi:hypothetical protein G6R29_03800 [Fructobacillus sp. M2-14]|uniref:Uncharacterized protein n=1 Tax=Fructobacillus broussonetiae TaxID=2713173 RepID=A0ABS5R165_9LACO|nr:hypothetical protein [Fructobacillus broussonetiae]MBS9338747.1 hypothetical protein [Fructobacillus broussonetiae]
MFKTLKGKVAFATLIFLATVSLVVMTLDSKPKKNLDNFQDQNRVDGQKDEDKESNDLTYFSGKKITLLPMTEGHLDNGSIYWKSQLTIHGKKTPVVASYYRMGYFAIYTKQPTDQIQSFTYNGDDYQKYIEAKDLDEVASKSEPYND